MHQWIWIWIMQLLTIKIAIDASSIKNSFKNLLDVNGIKYCILPWNKRLIHSNKLNDNY